jgi:hypothetical protein
LKEICKLQRDVRELPLDAGVFQSVEPWLELGWLYLADCRLQLNQGSIGLLKSIP